MFHRKVVFEFDRNDLLLLTSVFTLFLLISSFYSYLPSRLGGDEVYYIDNARRTIFNGEIDLYFADPLASDIKNLLTGRLFWILLTTGYIVSANLQASHAPLMNSMFLLMITLATALLVPKEFRKSKVVRLLILVIILTNPPLLSFSRTLLPDTAVAFYSTFAVYLFIKSLNPSDKTSLVNVRGLQLNTSYLSWSIVTSLIPLLIKGYILTFLSIFGTLVIIIIFMQYKRGLENKFLPYVIISSLIFYITIDILLSLLLYVFKISLPHYVYSFWIFSPFSFILKLITPVAGSRPLSSYNFYDYIQYLYSTISPEMLSPFVATSAFMLLLNPWVILKILRNNKTHFKVLVAVVLINLATFYIGSLVLADLYNILRYSIMFSPYLTVTTIFMTDSLFKMHPVAMLISYIGFTFLVISFRVMLMGKGIWLSYDLPKLPEHTFYLVMVLSFVTITVLFLYTLQPKIRLSLILRKTKVTLSKTPTLQLILITILVSNMYFSYFTIMNSSYSLDYNARMRNLAPSLTGKVIASNFYSFILPFVPDPVIKEGILLSLPPSESEFLNFVKILPNETLLVFAQDPIYAWYDFSNSYIERWIPPLDMSHVQEIKDDSILSLKFKKSSIFQDVLEHKAEIRNNTMRITAEGLSFGGNDYIYIPHSANLDFANQITIETWLKINHSEKNQAVVHGAKPFTPYNRSYYLGFNTKINEILWRIEGTNNPELRVYTNLKGWSGWTHVVATYDGLTMNLYVNGTILGSIKTTGDIVNENGITLGAGNSMPEYWFNSSLRELHIYNRALSATEVKLRYYLGLGYNPPVYVESREFPRGTISIYRFTSPIIWNYKLTTVNTIKNVKIYYTNVSNVRLYIEVNTHKTENITLIINTIRFSKILNLIVSPITRVFEFDFSVKDKGYGYYIGGWSRIIAIDSNFNVIYDDVIANSYIKPYQTLSLLWIFILLGVLCSSLIFSTFSLRDSVVWKTCAYFHIKTTTMRR